ncbi:MAG TPA: LysR substrate-binding domain-containing protein [Anaeromyxobacteraceae bacterium]|nr:LysR substrate-binding domain-containing protein [Anaeromyxobacteraceae bacterium]
MSHHRCDVDDPPPAARGHAGSQGSRQEQRRLDVEPVRCVVPDGVVIRELAKASLGLALLPRWLCADELRGGALVDVFPSYETTATDFESSLWLAYPSRSHLPLKVRVFVDFLKEIFRDGPPWECEPADAGTPRRGVRQA